SLYATLYNDNMPFIYEQWIKKKTLNYLNDIEPTKKPMRAQVLEVSTIRLETDYLKEKVYAKIHDKELCIRCFFSEECLQKFESERKLPINSLKGCHIIIYEFSFQFIKDFSIKSPGYDCFLNIKRFNYSTNVSDGLDRLNMKELYEDEDLKDALRKRYEILYPFSNP
ncbi:19600_t:CDS:2, partial [Dentiscutata erythropus]